jgi:hypothetical protein
MKRTQDNYSWKSEGKNEHYSYDVLKGFRVSFANAVYTVLMRKNEIESKPVLYLFDTQHKHFLSSLYPTGEEFTFIFDVKNTGEQFLLRFTVNNGMPTGYEIEKIS